jgi:iron complex outermembrane receptor protein
MQGTVRKAGDFRTPTYYLDNTGTQEGDFSADLGYKWKKLKLNLHYSEYNAEVGIFSGAEANSAALIDSAFKSPKPFAPSHYTYTIDRSYQVINHDLLKASASYTFKDNSNLELDFGLQKDLRKEYSADLPLTLNPAIVNMPQLSFQLNTQTLDLVYTQAAKNGFSGDGGFTGSSSGNIVQGLFYLVPNFRSSNGGLFYIERYSVNKLTFEAGVRYDDRWLQVYKENQTTLVDYNQTYTYTNNISGTVGASYKFSERLSASGNVGTGWRAPSINEMYIDGVHFSNAQFEIGDSALKSQRSVNTGLSLKYKTERLRVSLDVYYNIINNYIYEEPTLTYTPVYGVFYPTFQYTQSNVTIKGIDLVWAYDLFKHFTFQSKTSIVRGYNESIGNYLIFMPADRFQNELIYHFDRIGRVKNPYISLENTSVLTQTRVPPNSDYELPPAGYSVYNAHGGFFLPVNKNHSFNLDVSVNNITNVQYRDYLDQYRYFANELGVNLTVRLKYSF